VGGDSLLEPIVQSLIYQVVMT